MTITVLGREFVENKINPKHKEFDRAYFNDYKKFIVSIPETEVIKMDIKIAYDRIRFIGQMAQADYLKKAGYIPPSQRIPHEEPKCSDRNRGPTKAYKAWVKD